MLVTLGTNQGVTTGTPVTLQYSCTSVQKVFIYVEDSGQAISAPLISIQLGSRTIANSISGQALFGLSGLYSGVDVNNNVNFSVLDLGSHELFPGEQLSVTVAATGNDLTAVDISAVVNEPVSAMPLRYTEYADKVFTAENVLTSMIYASNNSLIDEITETVEVRTSLYSSAPQIASSSSYYMASCKKSAGTQFGLLSNNQLPLSTTFNYTQGTAANRILCVQAMPVSKSQIAQAGRNKAIAKAVVR